MYLSKSKFAVFSGILIGIMGINSANATEIKEAPTARVDIAITYFIQILRLLTYGSLAVVILSVFGYIIYSAKKDEQRKKSLKKILIRSVLFFLFFGILCSIIVLISQPCCLVDI